MEEVRGELYGKDAFKFKKIGVKRFRGGEMDLTVTDEDPDSLEDCLLEFEVGWYQKLQAWLGREVFLGDFRAEKPGCDFEHYYLAWCQVHRKYFVSYYRGNEPRLDCYDCNNEFLSDIEKNVERKPAKTNLKLIKSDRWPEP